MKKILVTGASGFVGSGLVKVLRKNKGTFVREFDTAINSKQSLLDKKAVLSKVRGCDTVFHLGAINDPSVSDIYDVNVEGTFNLLEALEQVPGCHLIFASSFAVYRMPKKGEVVDERFEVLPRNRYGLSKLLAEDLIARAIKTSNLKADILRSSNIYGPGMAPNRHSVVSTFFNQVAQNKPITIAGGTQTRDFIYIDDVVSAFVASAENLKGGNILNICSGEEISIRNLASLMFEVSGKKAKYTYLKGVGGGGYWKGSNRLAKSKLKWKPNTNLTLGLEHIWKERVK